MAQVGKYKGKTTNLTGKQLKTAVSAAGGKKVSNYNKSLGSATKVPIGRTKWVEGKGLVNADSPGTRITGTVTLPNGQRATYVQGRRLRAADAAKPRSTGNRTGGTGSASSATANANSGVKMTAREKESRTAAKGLAAASGPGLRGTASVRGKYGTGSGYKPNTVAPKKSGKAGSKASDRAFANLLTGAATYGKDYYKQSSADRLTPKKPGATKPKPSTRAKIQMPSNDAVKKATGGVYGMTAAGTPYRKAMPEGGQTDLIKFGASTLLTPGVGLAAGAVKGAKTVGQAVAGKVLGSKAAQAAGKKVAGKVVSTSTKVAGTKAAQAAAKKAGKTAAGKKVAGKVATSRANANAAKTQRWIDAENLAAKNASKADARARARAAANRAANAPTAAGRKTGLSNIRRNAEVPKYGRTKVGTAKTPKASVKRTFVNGVSQPVKKAAAKKTTPRKK